MNTWKERTLVADMRTAAWLLSYAPKLLFLLFSNTGSLQTFE